MGSPRQEKRYLNWSMFQVLSHYLLTILHEKCLQQFLCGPQHRATSHGMAWRQPASKSHVCLPLAAPRRHIPDPHPISSGRKRIGKGLAHILLKYLSSNVSFLQFSLLLCFYGNQIIIYQVTSETRQISCVPITIFLSKSESHYLSKAYASWHQDILKESILLYWSGLTTMPFLLSIKEI